MESRFSPGSVQVVAKNCDFPGMSLDSTWTPGPFLVALKKTEITKFNLDSRSNLRKSR